MEDKVSHGRMLKVVMFVSGEDRIEFWPVKNIPGFTHRVLVNGKKAGYLHHTVKVNQKSAQFFLAKAWSANYSPVNAEYAPGENPMSDEGNHE